MEEIRFVGQARGGRCVFCHDGLAGLAPGGVTRCEECRAAWHGECLEGGRCPTLGCSAPVLAAPPALVAPLPAAPPATTTIVTPGAPRPPRGERPHDPRWVRRRGARVPGLLARVGPYSRLIWSGLAHLALLAACVGLIGLALLHPAAWRAVSEAASEGLSRLLLVLAGGALHVAGAGLGVRYAARWLLRLPGVVRELTVLLDSTTPTLMDLEVLVLPDARGLRRWCARLHGRPGGPQAGRRYDLAVNLLLTPWWVTMWGERRARPVLVYGLPPPGPYVIEFEGGALALVHPDETTPGLLEAPSRPPAPRGGSRRRRKRRGHGR